MKQQGAEIDYRKVFVHSPELRMLLLPNPPEFTIVDASDAYLKATLTKREEITGKPLFTVFPDNPADPRAAATHNLRKSIEQVLLTKKAHVMPLQKYDVPVKGKAGSEFEEKYWNPMNTPVLNEANEVLYILHQAEDVTAAVQLEAKRINDYRIANDRADQNSQLIREKEERINLILEALLNYTRMDFSRRLSTSQKGDELDAIIVGLNSLIDELEVNMTLLRKSNMALEHANQELDSFSYSVSHDLRAPLRGINGYSQVLLEDYGSQLDETGKQNIAVIMRNALRMGNLIDDLLSFSRVGKQYISKVNLDMNQLAASVVQELNTPGEGNKATFNIKNLNSISGDSSMIKQVLTNLISNAIKYSSKKENPVIEIGCYPQNGAMVYYVKDNGAGFDMKYYDKLFGVFQRLHTAREFDGTGVGLAIVQRIIKKHEGDIWAEAVPDEGATFFFSLPITSNL